MRVLLKERARPVGLGIAGENKELNVARWEVRRVHREALREHRRTGVPVVGWREGEIVVIHPEDIRFPDEE